jgi:hypothetical protein
MAMETEMACGQGCWNEQPDPSLRGGISQGNEGNGQVSVIFVLKPGIGNWQQIRNYLTKALSTKSSFLYLQSHFKTIESWPIL